MMRMPGRLRASGTSWRAAAPDCPAPHDLAAERAVLGAVLVQGRIPPGLELDPSEYYRTGHQHVYRAMQRLHDRGDQIDLVTLRHELADKLDEAGGDLYLHGLVDGVPRSTNWQFYARIVRETWTARRALAVLDQTRAAIVTDPAAAGNGLAKLHVERWTEVTENGTAPRAHAMTLPELEAHDFPPRRVLLARNGTPVLRTGHLWELHGPRGIGKTLVCQSLMLAMATGTSALGFEAPEPCRVLDVDLEMAGDEKRARYQQLRWSLNLTPTENLVIVAADWQDRPMPRLDTPQGQRFIEPFVEAADVIVVDNRSTGFDPEGEKDPTAWQPAQDWLLSLRRRGKAVIVVRHSNRMGGARGHSKSEDVIDVSMKLSRPDDYQANQGARFRVEFDKARGVFGTAVDEFVTTLTSNGWVVEGADEMATGPERKIREYLRLAGDRPKSATAAIAAAKVQKAAGLKAWAAMLNRGDITQHPGGGYVLLE